MRLIQNSKTEVRRQVAVNFLSERKPFYCKTNEKPLKGRARVKNSLCKYYIITVYYWNDEKML